MRPPRPALRRSVVAVAVSALVLACAGEPTDPSPDPSASEEPPIAQEEPAPPPEPDDAPEERPDEADEAAVPPPPERAGPYELSPNEVLPNAKRLASDVAQELTTYDDLDELEPVLDRLATSASRSRDDLAAAVSPLLRDDAWSRGSVVYPQLGGLTDDATSVIVTVRQRTGDVDGVTERVRTFDVRLRIEGGEWVFDDLASAGGEEVPPPPRIPEVARAVLDDDRIDLPDSARWDVLAGRVDSGLLHLMSRAADQASYEVLVLVTGHSLEVFGTDRVSQHTIGEAVDIVRVDGQLVVDERDDEGSATHRLLEWFYDQPEVGQVGGPWALDGFGGRSFTDTVHQDHLHIGLSREGREGDAEVPSRRGPAVQGRA